MWDIFPVIKKGAHGKCVELDPHQCTGATSEVSTKKNSFHFASSHKIKSEKQNLLSYARSDQFINAFNYSSSNDIS